MRRPLQCVDCGYIFSKGDRVVGLPYPGKPSGTKKIVCLPCYRLKGGNLKRLQKFRNGKKIGYLTNPEMDEILAKAATEAMPYHTGPTRREIAEEQIIMPEELGKGWRLVAKFNNLNVAKLSARDFEIAGIAAVIVPIEGKKFGRYKMWAIVVKDPEAVEEEEPEPFTEEWFEWISAGKPYTSYMVRPRILPGKGHEEIGVPSMLMAPEIELPPTGRFRGLRENNPSSITNIKFKELIDKLGFKGSMRQLKMGIIEEMEHKDVTGGDLYNTARIAIAHLKEDSEYYTKLKKAGLEGNYMSNPRGKRKSEKQTKLQVGQLAGLSVGMVYKVGDAMRTKQIQKYGKYYLTPSELGVRITEYDIPKGISESDVAGLIGPLYFSSVDILVPYRSYRRVEEFIYNLESYLQYVGSPKEVVVTELYHQVYPDEEPPTYEAVVEKMPEMVFVARPDITFSVQQFKLGYIPIIYEMGREIHGPISRDRKQVAGWLMWNIDEINRGVREYAAEQDPVRKEQIRPKHPREVPIVLSDIRPSPYIPSEVEKFRNWMKIHGPTEQSREQKRYTLYREGDVTAGYLEMAQGGLIGWINDTSRKTKVWMTVNTNEITRAEAITKGISDELVKRNQEKRFLISKLRKFIDKYDKHEITEEQFNSTRERLNNYIIPLVEMTKALENKLFEAKRKIPEPVQGEVEMTAPEYGKHFRYYNEMIEWLQANKIPVNKDSEPIYAERRDGPNMPWKPMRLIVRAPTAPMPSEIEIVPLVDPDSWIPPPEPKKREKRGKPDEVIPLTEQNPAMSVIGLAAATGLASGIASGTTFAVINNHLREQSEKKKKQEEEK